MGKFKRIDTSIEGLCIIEPTVFGDNRGFFMETYNEKDFEEIGITVKFVQDNQSKSKKQQRFLSLFIIYSCYFKYEIFRVRLSR